MKKSVWMDRHSTGWKEEGQQLLGEQDREGMDRKVQQEAIWVGEAQPRKHLAWEPLRCSREWLKGECDAGERSTDLREAWTLSKPSPGSF